MYFLQMDNIWTPSYIPKEVTFLHVRGDILFARYQDEEDNYVVVKYKILNGPAVSDEGINHEIPIYLISTSTVKNLKSL